MTPKTPPLRPEARAWLLLGGVFALIDGLILLFASGMVTTSAYDWAFRVADIYVWGVMLVAAGASMLVAFADRHHRNIARVGLVLTSIVYGTFGMSVVEWSLNSETAASMVAPGKWWLPALISMFVLSRSLADPNYGNGGDS